MDNYTYMNLKTYKIFGRHCATIKINGIVGGFFAYGVSVQEAIAGAFANYYYWELNK